ncbi:MAG: transaldolase family protein [Lentisphaeria bacterium]|jgi:transaldolase|nr:transaldolase family protein [Lentisphaeria bacterium]
MSDQSYLQWLDANTPTTWWHDSADPEELRVALDHGASGVTTNPILAAQALAAKPDYWNAKLHDLVPDLSPGDRAEAILNVVTGHTARALMPVYEQTNGDAGYVCAQVNPASATDTAAMIAAARRFNAWSPNIAIKLPVTAAGLDTLEECAAEGMTITATVSFTVPQVIAVAERFRAGAERARQAGKTPGRCFAVIMIGRLDDYLRDIVHDRGAEIAETDIRQAGIAVCKRAYAIFEREQYEAVLLVAALRGVHHMTALAGARLVMSIHPTNQALLMAPDVSRREYIAEPVPGDVIDRLMAVDQFVRAYEPDGMAPADFFAYGVTQRTLTQFSHAGWMKVQGHKV